MQALSTLERLIRLHKAKVNEKRLFIGRIEARLQNLQTEIQGYYDTLSHESSLRDHSLTAQVMYPDYERGVHYKILRAKRYQQEVELQVEKEKEKLSESFAELKVLEITHRKRLEEMKMDHQKREQAELDELSQRAHLP